MKLPIPTAQQRMYFYGVIAALLGVLVFYNVIDSAAVPVWLGFAAVVLGLAGNTVAAVKVHQQIKDGTLS